MKISLFLIFTNSLLIHAQNKEIEAASPLCSDYRRDLTYDGYKYRPVYGRSHELGPCRISDFKFGKTLGKGGLGVVRSARHIPTGRSVAIKIGHPRFGDEHSYIRWRNEECLQHRTNHRYIAQHYCTMVSEDGGDIMLVVELVEGSSLHAVVKKDKHAVKIRTSRDIRRIAAQIAIAIEHAHDRGVVLRDVKPGNVMITRDRLQVRMIDFGLALDLWQDKAAIDEAEANYHPAMEDWRMGPLLQAPLHRTAFFEEIRRHNQYRPYIDYYGLGVTVYELFTGREYKKAQRERPQNYGDVQMKGFVCVRGMDPDACDFIQGITDLDWTRSAELNELRQWIRSHPWFGKIDWSHT